MLSAEARRAGGGRRAGRDFNATPKGSLLQRDAGEYSVLRWKRLLLSTRRRLETDAVEYLVPC